MIISYNSQLGLRFRENEVKVSFLTIMKDSYEHGLQKLHEKIEVLKNIKDEVEEDIKKGITETDDVIYEEIISDRNNIKQLLGDTEIRKRVDALLPSHDTDFITDDNSAYYFICDSVYEAAALIKISTGFTGRTLKDIEFGEYTYLMGKNRMVRFKCAKGAIRGFYFDDKNNIAFDWGIEMESGDYYFNDVYQKEFSTTMQVLSFVELGDIEVLELKGGRNNQGKKGVDKITNTSKNTVYVVDSTWNKILIRTDGFAVRGHFRLQPFGDGMRDRKLIWISAFEKHGYTRRPSAEIVR